MQVGETDLVAARKSEFSDMNADQAGRASNQNSQAVTPPTP